MVRLIDGLLLSREVIRRALMKTVPRFPEAVAREPDPNSLSYQDLFVSGTGSILEIRENHIEVTNSGAPLADISQFLDHLSPCCNEPVAKFTRRIGICEERGSGWDNAVSEV